VCSRHFLHPKFEQDFLTAPKRNACKDVDLSAKSTRSGCFKRIVFKKMSTMMKLCWKYALENKDGT